MAILENPSTKSKRRARPPKETADPREQTIAAERWEQNRLIADWRWEQRTLEEVSA